MRILLVHNRYLQVGGEDSTLATERDLLQKNHDLSVLEFDNRDIQGALGKLKLGLLGFYNPYSARRLREAIRSFKPDIIHVHNFYYVASPSIFYEAAKHRIPVVQTLHNYRLVCQAASLLRGGRVCELCINGTFQFHGIRHRCFNNSALQSAHLGLLTGMHKVLGTWREKIDTFIVPTAFMKQKLVNSSARLPESRVVIKPNCVEDKGDASGRERNRSFLFVGRLSSEKGIQCLLDAMNLGDFSLEIIGSGPLMAHVEAHAAEHASIVYHGRQDQDFVIEKMKQCQALVFPSIWYEGLPITILEAFSTGTPVIASDIDNIKTIVTDGYNGLHFAHGDSGALASKLREFLEEQSRNARLYKQARQTFEDMYTTQANYRQLVEIYAQTIADAKAR